MNASRRKRFDPSALAATEASIWDVYNNAADIRNNGLVENWKESLNSLLLFAAIFAAVLAALIVESMKMLQQDQGDVTTAILLRISDQLANNSVPAYQVDDFEAPYYAVIVNALFFTSLCCSIIAALAGVVALQWVDEFEAHLDNVDPRKYALVRHLRFLGVERWKMGEIIAILPLLLHAAVFLFFAGIIEWMRNVNRTIWYICIAGAASAAFFYMFTTTLRSLFGGVPFRTPMAKWLRIILLFSIFGIWMAVILGVYGAVLIGYLLVTIASLGRSRRVRRLSGRMWNFGTVTLPNAAKALLDLFHKMGLSDNVAIQDLSLERELVTWTATHVVISPQSLHRLVHILDHSYSLIVVDKVLHRSWGQALNKVAQSYLEDAATRDPSEADLPSLRIFVNIWTTFRTHFWSEQMITELKYQSWESWDPITRLVGPLDYEGTLQESEMALVINLLRISLFKRGEQSWTTLEEVSSAILNPDALLSPHIMRYAASNLSIYLWTRDYSEFYDRVADVLIKVINIPPNGLNRPLLGEIEMSLVASAIYSTAFGRPVHGRRFWASKHPLINAGQLQDKFHLVMSLHSAILSQFAAAASQATSANNLRMHLRRLCHFLAYTPCSQARHDENAHMVENLLITTPHFLEDHSQVWNTNQRNAAALPSVIWISHITDIPRIHEYLNLLLLSRNRCPPLQPMWRDWDVLWTVDFDPLDRGWLSTLKDDRRLVEVLNAFDQLVTEGCSEKERATLVSLVIDDLDLNNGTEYNGYYTQQRRQQLTQLQDPALRLLGIRAAGIPYSGMVPAPYSPKWDEEAWVRAMAFWCTRYQECEPHTDNVLLCNALKSNSELRTLVTNSSSTNLPLQRHLRNTLRSSVDQNNPDALELHAYCQATPWFAEYLTSSNILDGLVQHVPSADFRNPQVVSLTFVTLLPLVESPHQLDNILTGAYRAASYYKGCSCLAHLDEISAAFEDLLRLTPELLVPVKDASLHLRRTLLSEMNDIIPSRGVQANRAYSLLLWEGRNPGAMVNRDWEKSCSATWTL